MTFSFVTNGKSSQNIYYSIGYEGNSKFSVIIFNVTIRSKLQVLTNKEPYTNYPSPRKSSKVETSKRPLKKQRRLPVNSTQ